VEEEAADQMKQIEAQSSVTDFTSIWNEETGMTVEAETLKDQTNEDAPSFRSGSEAWNDRFRLMLPFFVRTGDRLHGQSSSFQISRDFRLILHILQELIFVALELVYVVPDD
jgi:hypothetical protein